MNWGELDGLGELGEVGELGNRTTCSVVLFAYISYGAQVAEVDDQQQTMTVEMAVRKRLFV